MPDFVISAQWKGGINSALDPAFIAPDEIQDGSNFIARDGTLRLDRRYIIAAQLSSGSPACTGSGWGKFGTGAQSFQYLGVLGGQLYQIDGTQSALSLTTVGRVAASQMGTGNWFFTQFLDHIYMGNAALGLARKLIGAGSNGTGDFELVRAPTAPTIAPTAPRSTSTEAQAVWTGSTVSMSAGTSLYTAASDSWLFTFTSGQVGPQTIDITFKTSASDNRPDWSNHDILQVVYGGSLAPSFIGMPDLDVFSTAGGTTPTRAIPWIDPVHGPFGAYYRVSNLARTTRAQVTKLRFSVVIPAGGGTVRINSPKAGGVWLSLDRSASVGLNDSPVFPPLLYEYTYYNSQTGFESAPSPVLTIASYVQSQFGDWRDVTATAGGVSDGVDKLRFYRRIEAGGAVTRCRLAELPNPQQTGAQVVWTDKIAADEAAALPIFKPSVLPSSGITAIGSWLNRMVLGAGALVYISRDDNPLAFEQQSGPFDPFDASRGFTFYPDDRRAEQVLGLAGLDSLYIITDYSVRCLFGSTPDNWRLIKLPVMEGAVGPRAWCAYKNGVLVLTPSGRLIFCTIGMGSTLNVSGAPAEEASYKVRARLGNLGIKAIATADAVVSVTPDGEIVVENQTGVYYILDVEGNWRKGTRSHPAHSALYVSGQPTRWFGVNGKFYQGGDDSYVSDGGTTGINGTPVTWNIKTRKDHFVRSGLSKVLLISTQVLTQVAGKNVVAYPRVTPICRRTLAKLAPYVPETFSNLGTRRTIPFPAWVVDEEMTLLVEGDKDTIINEIRATYSPKSPAPHL